MLGFELEQMEIMLGVKVTCILIMHYSRPCDPNTNSVADILSLSLSYHRQGMPL